jgi:flagellar basal-body rod modification protein FlgD
MEISAARPSALSTTAAAGGAKANMDYDAFLKLLIAQMQNQDPTSPMDSTEYVAQFASFSQVEQSLQINAKLDSLLTSAALSQADAVIGRTITSADGKISGKCESITIVSGGAIAMLDNGKQIPLGPGIKIS